MRWCWLGCVEGCAAEELSMEVDEIKNDVGGVDWFFLITFFQFFFSLFFFTSFFHFFFSLLFFHISFSPL